MTPKQERTYRSLDIQTRDQRSKYYSGVINWNVRNLERIASTDVSTQGRYGIRQHHVDSAKEQLQSRLGLLTLEWLKEAENFWNTKLEVMVQKLDGFGFLEDDVFLIFSDMEISSSDFGFWIRASKKGTGEPLGRVYARLVEVDGVEKCFHYRFVTTLKK